jgi:hypothetical protein
LSHEDFLALMEMERSVRAGVEAVMAERRANVAEAS